MGVYIKGMEMPKNGYDCPLCRNGMCRVADDNSDGICLVYGPDEEHRPSDCPLVEVLPHGDLIDRDELMKTLEITEECEKCKSHIGVHCTRVYFVGACEAICDAPTIIEAEEWLKQEATE